MLKEIYRKIRSAICKQFLKIQYYFANEICDISVLEAKEVLNKLAPMPKSSAVTKNETDEIEFDLVIIIPAYNAEKWIRECLDSVLNQQTDYRFQAVVVDDGSVDKTGNIIDSYLPNERLKVIHQENRGYSGARNVALKNLCSKYIMFVDSDDFILPGTLNVLLKKAFENDADIVEGNGYRFDENGRIGSIKAEFSDYWGGPCLKVIKASIFANILFPEGYLYEDTIISSLVFPKANKVITIPDEIYAYRIHAGSITQKHDSNIKRVDSFWIMLLMKESQDKLGIVQDYERYKNVMQHIIFTYRRTVLLPEKIKRCIFIRTAVFLENNYKGYLNMQDEYRKLTKAILTRNYGKYSVFCKGF